MHILVLRQLEFEFTLECHPHHHRQDQAWSELIFPWEVMSFSRYTPLLAVAMPPPERVIQNISANLFPPTNCGLYEDHAYSKAKCVQL